MRSERTSASGCWDIWTLLRCGTAARFSAVRLEQPARQLPGPPISDGPSFHLDDGEHLRERAGHEDFVAGPQRIDRNGRLDALHSAATRERDDFGARDS